MISTVPRRRPSAQRAILLLALVLGGLGPISIVAYLHSFAAERAAAARADGDNPARVDGTAGDAVQIGGLPDAVHASTGGFARSGLCQERTSPPRRRP